MYIVADVSDPDNVREIAETAQEVLGGFDTWVNNAGVFIFGRLQDVPVEDIAQAVRHQRLRPALQLTRSHETPEETGGELINIGSVLSDRAILL